MIVTQDLVCSSILSLHLRREMVSSVRVVKFGQNGKLIYIARKVKCI